MKLDASTPNRKPLLPRWRKMTWVLVTWSVLQVLLAMSASGSRSCQTQGFVQVCSGGLDAGRWLTFAGGGFIVLALIWFMSSPVAQAQPAPDPKER